MQPIDQNQAPCISRRTNQLIVQILFAIALISLIGTFLSLFIPNPASDLLFMACIAVGPLALFASRFFAQMLLRRVPMLVDAAYDHSFGTISICVDKEEVKNNPVTHLENFVTQIGDRKSAYISVEFIGQRGIDGGGLTQDYLDDLLSGLVQKDDLFTQIDESALFVPKAEIEASLEIFEKLGRLIGFCCPKHTIGYHLDPSIFAVAFALRAEELDHPFEVLSTERKLALYRALLESQGVEIGLFHPLTLYTANQLSERQNQVLTELLSVSELPNERENLLILMDEQWENQLRGIHALAKGMKAQCVKWGFSTERTRNWKWNNSFFQTDAHAYSRRIQGSINRAQIISQIVIENANQEVQQKANWLINWITNRATDDELKQLLKYITGSTGLKPNRNITILGGGSPSPSVHTCGDILELPRERSGHDLYNDHNEENFINWMKFIISDTQNYTFI